MPALQDGKREKSNPRNDQKRHSKNSSKAKATPQLQFDT
jgi:hypothetical protein